MTYNPFSRRNLATTIPILSVVAGWVMIAIDLAQADTLAVWFLVLATIIGNVGTLGWGLVARWWTSEEGRTIWSLLFVITLALDYIALSLAYGPFPYRDVIRYATYSILFLALVRLLVLVVRRQVDGRRRRHELRSYLLRSGI